MSRVFGERSGSEGERGWYMKHVQITLSHCWTTAALKSLSTQQLDEGNRGLDSHPGNG